MSGCRVEILSENDCEPYGYKNNEFAFIINFHPTAGGLKFYLTFEVSVFRCSNRRTKVAI